MKDLQEVFESIGYDEIKHLAELIDKKSLNPKSTQKVLDIISIAYCGEKNVKEAELSAKEMEKLIDNFNLSVCLYLNVIDGKMEMDGRIKLTDGGSATFKLTQKGIEDVEKMIRK